MADIDLKKNVNKKHIKYYDKAFSILNFLLKGFIRDIKSEEPDFLELSKNTITTLDFLISAMGKVQKGQRLALGMEDNEKLENEIPQISIVEGLTENKI